MIGRTLGILSFICAVGPSPAAAEEVLERVSVRNRLYSVAGRPELSASVGFSADNRLTSQVGFNLSAAMNLVETFAIEARAGYAIIGHTPLAGELSSQFLSRSPALTTVDDFSNLWEMRAHLTAGLRWTPIYGKLSLVSELPIHFQAYAWLGGGGGSFHRESVVYCLAPTGSSNSGQCDSWLTQNRIGWLGTGAVGMRFFTHQHGALRIELRDFVYADPYRVNIDVPTAESGNRTSGSISKGVMQLVMADVGYSFFF